MLKEFIKTQEDAKIALLGTLFADGHIIQERKDGTYRTKTYAEITHTSKQLDLLKAVKELFELINTECTIKEHNKNTENKTYTLFRLSTKSTEWLSTVRNMMYDNKIKVFRKELVDLFSDLSLLLLYLDDGTLRVRLYPGTSKLREARISFCLDSFTYEELKYFQQYLLKKWNIKTGIYRHSKNMPINRGFRVWTNTENTKKFMSIIDKYYNSIPSMNYKFLKYYSL